MGKGRRAGWIFGVLAALLALGTCRFLMRERPMVQAAEQRRELGAVAFVDAGGRPATLAEARGRVVLLHVWNTGNGHRLRTLEELADLQRQADGAYQVLPVVLDPKGRESLAAFLKDNPGLSLRSALPTHLGTFAAPFGGPVYLPTTFVVDRHGRLREQIGPRSSRNLRDALREALQER
jgi:thiol-disulfide isomerase/thioredoxin